MSERPHSCTAGYSGTPLPRKLGIKEGGRVAFLGAPPEFAGLVAPLPDGVEVLDAVEPGLDVVVFFTVERARLEAAISGLREAIAPDGAVWVAWPKRASGVKTDMTEDVVREIVLPLGMVDNKVAAIDATWSGLRVVIRRENR
ncbi:MAG TPA: DUF3052 domain-containing protein [Solirubrobacteraceae bacterium]|nr:DUF3052 domain-containing protein [Solirubrobacteraceae bacterium]